MAPAESYVVFGSNRKFFVILLVFTGPFFFFYASFPVVNYFSASIIERFMTQSYVITYVIIGVGIKAVAEGIAASTGKYPGNTLRVLWYGVCALFLVLTGMTQILRFTGFRNDMTGNYLGYDILDTTEKNSIILLSGDTQLFITQYVRYALGYRNDVILLPLNNVLDARYIPLIHHNFPDLQITEADDQTGIVAFLNNNIGKHRIYSNVHLAQPGYIALPYGLLYELVPDKKLPTETDYLKRNDELWASYHIREITNGILKQYRHIVLYDVLSRYSEPKSEFASILFRLGKYEKALETADEAIAISGDFGVPQAYSVKGMTYFAMNNCQESIENMEKSMKLNPAFDESVASDLMHIYEACNADASKIDSLQRLIDTYQSKKGIKLK